MSSAASQPVHIDLEPTSVDVVFDSNYLDGGWAVALLKTGARTEVGFRMSGTDLRPFAALQQSRNPLNWILLPEELGSAVLETAIRLRSAQEEEILRGYQAMAADEEREREALEWSEALIGDGLEAR